MSSAKRSSRGAAPPARRAGHLALAVVAVRQRQDPTPFFRASLVANSACPRLLYVAAPSSLNLRSSSNTPDFELTLGSLQTPEKKTESPEAYTDKQTEEPVELSEVNSKLANLSTDEKPDRLAQLANPFDDESDDEFDISEYTEEEIG